MLFTATICVVFSASTLLAAEGKWVIYINPHKQNPREAFACKNLLPSYDERTNSQLFVLQKIFT